MVSTGEKIGIGAGIAAVIGGAIYFATKSSAAVPNYSITISGPSDGVVGQSIPLNVTVIETSTNLPVSGITVTLTDQTTGTSSSSTTNSSGIASFDITFTNPGTYSFIATATVP